MISPLRILRQGTVQTHARSIDRSRFVSFSPPDVLYALFFPIWLDSFPGLAEVAGAEPALPALQYPAHGGAVFV